MQAAVYRGPGDLREGFVWVASGDDRVRPVKVEVGLTDGTRTEVAGEELSETDRVVIGVEQARNGGDDASPFVPRQFSPRRPQQ